MKMKIKVAIIISLIYHVRTEGFLLWETLQLFYQIRIKFAALRKSEGPWQRKK